MGHYASAPLRLYAPLRPCPSTPLPLYAPSADSPPTTKHLKYLSNHRVFPHPNPTQETPLLALSNAPSFIRFHEAVLEIASTHNIAATVRDIATPNYSLDAR